MCPRKCCCCYYCVGNNISVATDLGTKQESDETEEIYLELSLRSLTNLAWIHFFEDITSKTRQ